MLLLDILSHRMSAMAILRQLGMVLDRLRMIWCLALQIPFCSMCHFV